jgi:V/A-type H+-transporting ATPase subunit G/H
MEEVLKRLLEIEHKAETIVDAAEAERDRVIAAAQADAHAAAAQLEARLPELRASFLDKAQERAEQNIAELTRRATERQRDLRRLGESHEQEALAATLALLVDPTKG